MESGICFFFEKVGKDGNGESRQERKKERTTFQNKARIQEKSEKENIVEK